MDETNNIIKICDSSHNHSRKTLKYIYNPETDILGKGGFGQVFKVQMEKENSNDIKFYAIKILSKNILIKDPDKKLSVLNEIKIHRNLQHEHICKFEHSFEDENNVYILMEYCPCGTLLNFLKMRRRLEEIEIRFYMFQILKVIKYFRIQKIVHRDLTLKNIFLKDYKTVKLSDFGLAYRECESEDRSGIICGTSGYLAPESNLSKYSYKTDIFCFGMCIYYLFGGKKIFFSSQESYDYFLNGEFEPDNNLKLSKEALDLLKKLITIESKRIRIEKIFQHPFFNNGKGLEIENFPDFNNENYMTQIKDLNDKFGIKPTSISYYKINKLDLNSSKSDGSKSDSFNNNNENNLNNDQNLNKGITFRGNLMDGNNFKNEENKNIFNNSQDRKDNINSNNYFMFNHINKIDLSQIIYIVNTYNKAIESCGIYYKLNNNNKGFAFNDNTQLTKVNEEEKYLFYHHRDKLTGKIENIIIKFPLKNLKKEMMKKIKFFFQVENELKKQKIKEKKYIKNKNIINNIYEDVYVQKYRKGCKCMVFLLSNRNIQVNFFDGIIILFILLPKALIYFSSDNIYPINVFPLKENGNFSDINCENISINYKIKCALEEIKK